MNPYRNDKRFTQSLLGHIGYRVPGAHYGIMIGFNNVTDTYGFCLEGNWFFGGNDLSKHTGPSEKVIMAFGKYRNYYTKDAGEAVDIMVKLAEEIANL